jgi:hypothetical protein
MPNSESTLAATLNGLAALGPNATGSGCGRCLTAWMRRGCGPR